MGFNIGGLVKSLVNPATLMQLAAGPAGWATLAAKAVAVAIGGEVLQQLGQKLGLPQGVIDMAKSALSTAAGAPGGAEQSIGQTIANVAKEANLSPVEQGRMEREAFDVVDMVVKNAKSKSTDSSEGDSFLMRLAKALGKVMDKKMGQMDSVAKDLAQLSEKNNKAGSPEAQAIGTKNNMLAAYGQELGILSNAFAQVTKSVGEAQVTAARK